MKKIWKFQLNITDEQVISLPLGSIFLSAQLQDDVLCTWVLVPVTELALRERRIFIFGTGNPLPDDVYNLTYIDTVQEGQFVWHVFVSSVG